ncbi:MAG: hydroxymethylbilane synthase [Betaproteobacteria bacterium]|nr:hydroxymethylbilane synthase [Betaproteobacteria bacterium]
MRETAALPAPAGHRDQGVHDKIAARSGRGAGRFGTGTIERRGLRSSESVTRQVPARIVIATRESALALWQAHHVEARLAALYPETEIRLLGMTTEGDRRLGASLAKVGGKGLFVKELEAALEAGDADIAVHSMKDVPMTLPEGFIIAAIGEREDPRDAFVSTRCTRLSELPAGAVVGTSSLRRESQIRARYPGLTVAPLRGNVQTRLRKLDAGEFDAVILAAAGLKRLGLESRITACIPTEESVPAVGQGALGVECRAARTDMIAAVAALNDDASARCVRAERALSRALAGSCNLPLGGYARIENGRIHMTAFVANPDGSQHLTARGDGGLDAPEALGEALARELFRRGAAGILARAAAT